MSVLKLLIPSKVQGQQWLREITSSVSWLKSRSSESMNDYDLCACYLETLQVSVVSTVDLQDEESEGQCTDPTLLLIETVSLIVFKKLICLEYWFYCR